MLRPLIIINPAAAEARHAWPIISARLRIAGLEFDSFETSNPGDASSQTRLALQSRTTTIAVVGGDGTLSEASEGFFEFNDDLDQLPARVNPQASLAVIPAGTGDDYARGLTQGTRSPLEYWIDLLIAHCRAPQGNVRLVDVLYGRCDQFKTPFICLNASTMGIGGETAARVAAQGKLMRRLSGEIRFAIAAMAALADGENEECVSPSTLRK